MYNLSKEEFEEMYKKRTFKKDGCEILIQRKICNSIDPITNQFFILLAVTFVGNKILDFIWVKFVEALDKLHNIDKDGIPSHLKIKINNNEEYYMIWHEHKGDEERFKFVLGELRDGVDPSEFWWDWDKYRNKKE